MLEKETKRLLETIENDHLKAVEELENLYEKKLAFESEKYFQMEAKSIEMKLKFEKEIKDLNNKNEKNILLLK
jgi:cilia- and flagella-associated protein 57